MNTRRFIQFSVIIILILMTLSPGSVNAHSPQVLYATPGGLTSGSCESWANVCELQYALASAASGQEIWVAAGVYKPTSGTDRTATFQLKNGVGLYGGFAGTEVNRDQRDWQTNVTILSGDIDNNDTNTDGNYIAESINDIQGNNAYHVVKGSGTNNTAVLDGFFISAGKTLLNWGVYPNSEGGGMFNEAGNPTIIHVTFSGNSAGWGGGMYNRNSSPLLTDVTFIGNACHWATAWGWGGGIYNYLNSNPVLIDVRFINNSVYQDGGALYNHTGSNPQLTNVTFIGNYAHGGAGMMNINSSNPTLTNVTFLGNRADSAAGIYNYNNSSPTLTNVVFSGNFAARNIYYDSVAMMNQNGSNPVLTNVTFNHNIGGNAVMTNTENSNPVMVNTIMWGSALTTSGLIYNDATSNTTLTYSDMESGYPGANNIDADPLFADADGADDIFGTADDDLQLLSGSPAIDVGNDATCPATDQRDITRPQGAHCDMGAYEYQPPIRQCSSNMLSYWTFDEGNGQIADDIVDGNPLTLGTSSEIDSHDPVWTTGNLEGSLMFDGVDDLLRGGSLPQITEGTIEAWVNRTAYGNYPNPVIFGLFRPGTYTGAIFILQADSNLFGTKIFEWVKMDSSNKQIRLATTDNAWEYNNLYYIVATWGASGMKFYINGVLSDSTIYDGEVETSNPTTDFIGSTAPIEIGDYIAYGHAGWQPFAGTIDDVAVYNRALTLTEVQQHYQNGLNGYSYCEQPPADTTPPTIVPTVSGTQGNNSWYISDVTVSWDVSDSESGIASSVGCDTTTLTTDTSVDPLTCSATNGVGLLNSASVTIPIDKTAPTIAASIIPALPASGWWNLASGVPTVSFTCSDATSGLAGTCPESYTFPEGENQSHSQTIYDNAGNSASDGVSNIDVDLIAPMITWNSLINDGDAFYFGSVPTAPTCTASDNLSGLDGSCVVSGYAATVGLQTLTATAKDNAGNQSTETRTYTVLAWTLQGFYQPVDMNGVYNIVKGGSTVPLKFEVFAGSTELTDIAYIKGLTYAQTSCDATATTDEIETIATGGTSLRYDVASGQFIYNWKTPSAAGRCYRVTMTTMDGSSLVAYFKLK